MSRMAGFWSRRRVVLGSLAGVVAIYALLGFVVAPWVLKGQIVEQVGSLTGRTVTVERVRVNPFALSLTVEGFLVKDLDGSRLASFDRLYVNAAPLRLVRREVGVEDFQIDRPYLHAGLDAKGQLNVADILKRLSEDDGKAPPPKSTGGVAFAVGHLRIGEAQIDFTDRSRRRPFETTVGPISLELRNFRTRRDDSESPYTFSGRTESGERFAWSGNVLIEPIQSKGTFTFEGLQLPKYAPYYQDSTNAEIRKGTLGLTATYDLEWGTERRVVKIVDGSLSLRDLAVGARDGGDPVVELPAFDVSGFHADVLTRDTSIARMALEGGRIRVRRGPDGAIDLVALLRPPPPDEAAAPDAPAATPGGAGTRSPAGGARAPSFRLDELSVKGVRFEVEDAVPSPPVESEIEVERLVLAGLSTDPAARATIDAAARIDGSGKVTAKGSLRPHQAAGELDLAVERLDLSPLTPYLAGFLEARLEEAVLGMTGHATFDGSKAEPVWAFRGDFRLDGLRMTDGRHGEEFLRWKSLRLEGVDAAPGRTALRSVRLLEPRLRAVIWEDGVRNLDVVARREPAPPSADGEPDPAASPVPPDPVPQAQQGAPAAPAQRWSIGTLQVTNGRASLVDRSVKPAATMEMTELTVVVRGLSSEPRSSAQVQADARVGGAPVSVSGRLQPRFLGDATDLAIKSHAIDLTPLGPYVARFAGYELQKGKLDLDLRYAVKARTLEAQNVARIDQFTLGEERPGPDVTSLPVKLGLAILTDKDGVIEIDVPMSGSIDDPDFSVGRMAWKAIGNLFTKLVTAPFAALGKLFGGGGGESLEKIDFPAGGVGLDPASEKTLDVLAKALRERPALRLEVEGSTDEITDGAALRKEQAGLEVRRAKWTALRGKQPGLALDAVQVAPEEYPRWLAVAFAAIPPLPGAAAEPKAEARGARAAVAPEEMEAALAAAARVPPEAYAELAARRADAARDRLLAGGGLEPARVFVAAGGERARKEGGSRVYFELR
ncbi:MAG: hypothetical protein H6Q88_1618 [Anaeromyxobacteraceae bacterium]|nr:hypothetical protein [Anaeromyxobacteraceae bacterium]